MPTATVGRWAAAIATLFAGTLPTFRAAVFATILADTRCRAAAAAPRASAAGGRAAAAVTRFAGAVPSLWTACTLFLSTAVGGAAFHRRWTLPWKLARPHRTFNAWALLTWAPPRDVATGWALLAGDLLTGAWACGDAWEVGHMHHNDLFSHSTLSLSSSLSLYYSLSLILFISLLLSLSSDANRNNQLII